MEPKQKETSSESKKSGLVKMLLIYYKYSDADHKLKQNELADLLYKEYGVVLERKAISRNILLLQDCGIKIVNTGSGSYLEERPFENSELRMLIDSVLSSKYIPPKYSHDLIEKLTNMGNKYFTSHIKNIYAVDDWFKTDNATVFYTVDIIDEAIDKHVKISFDYNKYGVDKKLHPTTSCVVSPYQLILRNQLYYLIGYNEKWEQITYYKVDHITNIKLKPRSEAKELRSIEGYENGLDYKQISANPYMYSDDIKRIEFNADKYIVNYIVEWFGKNATIEDRGDYVNVVVYSSLQAMEYWMLQFIKYVDVVSPNELKDRLKNTLQEALSKFEVEE